MPSQVRILPPAFDLFCCVFFVGCFFMKRSGLMNSFVREIVVDLEKHGKRTKSLVWLDIARRINVSSRRRVCVNVFELSKLLGKNEGKIFVVPGKLLSKGSVGGKLEVACLFASDKAREKIVEKGGRVLSFKELIELNPSASKLVVVG